MNQLDFIYMPSTDVAADMEYFTSVLGGRLIFAVEGMGTRVAMVELTEDPPRILLAGHLDGDTPVLVYRVADLETATAELTALAGPGKELRRLGRAGLVPARVYAGPLGVGGTVEGG